MTDDPMKRFDKLLKAMVSGPPPAPKEGGEKQQSAGLPEGDRRRKPGPRS
ncbi:MAG TPA: hypothetical protein VF650_08415 [Allosphingosinicella sp.]|jgi:hypothetical protein